MSKSKLLKSNLATKIEEENIFIIKCKNIHGQEVTLGVEPTLSLAEKFKCEWIENHTNRYWVDAGKTPDVYFVPKPVNSPQGVV